MNHPAELKVHKFLSDVRNGDAAMTEAALARIVSDVAEALDKQFGDSQYGDFRLRMSNIGRDYCQLWYDKHKPEVAEPLPSTFVMNMLIGDIVEAAFKGILTSAGVSFEDGHKASMELGEYTIEGTHDIVIDGKVDDIKSASPWSYTNKFKDYDSLAEHDSFGYVDQLVGYSKALGVPAGGWWVVNKGNGEFKYVPASGLRKEAEHTKRLSAIEEKAKLLDTGSFYRCHEDQPETFRGKETGNRILGVECGFCRYKQDCWPNAKMLPSIPSKAKEPKLIWYTEVAEDGDT
jgi:hypothetical protein